MSRRLASAIVALATALGSVFLLLGMAESARAEEIPADMSGNAFVPGDMTITVGDTVTWTNSDSVPHTVTSDDGGPLDSGIIPAGGTWSYTFTEPGTYSFYCEVHPNMQGTVTVVPASTTTTTAPHGGGHPTTTTTAPSSTPTTAPPPPPTTTPPPGDDETCPSSVAAALAPFWAHFQTAHLETSVFQQVTDAMNVGDYALAHTVLMENMAEPLADNLVAALGGIDPFWAHFQTAHLQTSPFQQASDAMSVDDYALAHTVLFGNMLSPGVEPLAGSC